MSDALILLPFIEEANPKYASIFHRALLNSPDLPKQANKTTYRTIASFSGRGYIDRAILMAYWSYFASQWLRFRIVADGATVFDQLLDTANQSTANSYLGVGHTKYLSTKFSDTSGQDGFTMPVINAGGAYLWHAPVMATPAVQVGLPAPIVGGPNDPASSYVTAITEPIYFNSSLSIEVSMGGSLGQGAIQISGGLV
jgi:hypothetical protein